MTSGLHEHPAWADELLDLAVQEATGRLVVASRAGEFGWVWLRDGQLSGVSAATRRPLLSRRLVAFEVMSEEHVHKVLEAIRLLPGQRLLDLIIQERLAPDSFIDRFVRHVMAEQLASLLAGSVAAVSFEPGRVQRVSPLLLPAPELLMAAQVTPFRIPEEIAEHTLTAGARDFSDSYAIQRSVLVASDGHRRPIDVADMCGLTTAEILTLIATLEKQGVLQVTAAPDRESWQEESWKETRAITTVADTDDELPALHSGSSEPEPVMETVAPEDGLRSSAGDHRKKKHRSDPPIEPAPARDPEQGAERPQQVTFDAPPPVYPPPAEPGWEPLATADDADEPAPAEPTVRLPQPDGDDDREAMSLLSSLSDSVTPDPPVPTEPQAEVTTTSRPPVWPARAVRPSNPMESSDVLRELQSLGEPGETSDDADPPANPKGNGEGQDKKRRLFGR